MIHGPAVEWKDDKTVVKKTRMGIIMVSIYILVYAVFVTLNVVNPKLMKMDIGSLNLAIVYGFGLILLAVVQAVIYNHYCTRLEDKAEAEDAAGHDDSNGGEMV
ncbi:MAG: DUF485 domain-containing protein [Saccharofermentanales bacterium]